MISQEFLEVMTDNGWKTPHDSLTSVKGASAFDANAVVPDPKLSADDPSISKVPELNDEVRSLQPVRIP